VVLTQGVFLWAVPESPERVDPGRGHSERRIQANGYHRSHTEGSTATFHERGDTIAVRFTGPLKDSKAAVELGSIVQAEAHTHLSGAGETGRRRRLTPCLTADIRLTGKFPDSNGVAAL
jgi:hypothetical protein